MKRHLFLAAIIAGCGSAQPAVAADSREAVSDSGREAASQFPPLFDAELARARSFVDGMIEGGVVVPIPRDPGGGYTHEQHKRNYRAIHLSGQLFRITGELRYRDYARDLLLEYAQLYPTLGEHPEKHDQYSGRLFWQVLNEAMWLVHDSM